MAVEPRLGGAQPSIEASSEHADALSEGGFELLRAAINQAREHQCKTVAALKLRLQWGWPGRDADIDEALNFWSASIRRRHPNGVPRQ